LNLAHLIGMCERCALTVANTAGTRQPMLRTVHLTRFKLADAGRPKAPNKLNRQVAKYAKEDSNQQ
jgi:hypothetical protein